MVTKMDPPAPVVFETYHFCPRHPKPVVAEAKDIPGALGSATPILPPAHP